MIGASIRLENYYSINGLTLFEFSFIKAIIGRNHYSRPMSQIISKFPFVDSALFVDKDGRTILEILSIDSTFRIDDDCGSMRLVISECALKNRPYSATIVPRPYL